MRLLVALACFSVCGVPAVRLKKARASGQAQDAQNKSALASWLQFRQETQQTFQIASKYLIKLASKMDKEASIAMTRETIDTVRNKDITRESFPKTAQVLAKAGCKCEMPEKEGDSDKDLCQVDIYFDAGMYAPRSGKAINDAGMWAVYIDGSEELTDRVGEFQEMLWSGERRHLSKDGFERLLADESIKFVLRLSSAAGLSKLEVNQTGVGTKHTQLAGKNWVLAAGEWQFETNEKSGQKEKEKEKSDQKEKTEEKSGQMIIDLNSGTYMAKVKHQKQQSSADMFVKWLSAFMTAATRHPTKVQRDDLMYPDDYPGPCPPFVQPDQPGFEDVLCGEGPDDFMAKALTKKAECVYESQRPKDCVCHVSNCGA